MKIKYRCTECENEDIVDVYPVIPAKVYGPPEFCHPEEGGEIEPEACEECGLRYDQGLVHEQAAEECNERLERDDE
jgi:hypothetical protein